MRTESSFLSGMILELLTETNGSRIWQLGTNRTFFAVILEFFIRLHGMKERRSVSGNGLSPMCGAGNRCMERGAVWTRNGSTGVKKNIGRYGRE